MKKLIAFLSMSFFAAAMLPVAAGAQSSNGSLGLKAYGGPSCIGGGDFNSGQKGWADFYGIIFGLLTYSSAGEIKPVDLGLNFGGEAIYRFSPALGIGLGFGLIQASKTSEMTFTPAQAGLDVLSYEAKTQLNAAPFTLSAYYFPPLKGKMSFFIQAGLGPCLAWGYASQRMSDEDGGWTLNEIKAHGGGVGFHGGIGLEYELGRRLAFFAEVRGRLASFANFKGEADISDNTGWSESVSGLLWNERVDLGSLGSVETIEVSDSEPTGSGVSDAWRTRINFSGVSFVLGVVFRL
ncbi:MAG: hypothetical protein A2Y56_15785 [Candidatus Aminicenantes bacterium RBG_13_63_10]|nr:MAG: hypothetical protein A2Y56_15785 [Candidatus Aminicenantes bacterium RBG_13_63_10]